MYTLFHVDMMIGFRGALFGRRGPDLATARQIKARGLWEWATSCRCQCVFVFVYRGRTHMWPDPLIVY